MSSGGKKLDFLQALRALAATIVVFYHFSKEIMHRDMFAHSDVLYIFRSGSFGVDIFFIISGFIMVFTTQRALGGMEDSKAFLIRRLIRIVPIYWFYTTLFVLTLLAAPGALRHSGAGIAHIVSSYLFFPYPRPGDGTIEPVLGLGWTLNYEMLFYIVFSVLLLMPRRFLLPALTAFFVVLVCAGIFIGRQYAAPWYWTRSVILEFLFGALIAQAMISGWKFPPWLAAIVFVAGIVGWQVSFLHWGYGVEDQVTRGIFWGIPAALLVMSVALTPQVRAWFDIPQLSSVISVGDSSYSLYLSHLFVMRALAILLPVSLLGRIYPLAFFAVGIPCCLVVAHYSYKWLEAPVTLWGRRFLPQSVPQPAA